MTEERYAERSVDEARAAIADGAVALALALPRLDDPGVVAAGRAPAARWSASPSRTSPASPCTSRPTTASTLAERAGLRVMAWSSASADPGYGRPVTDRGRAGPRRPVAAGRPDRPGRRRRRLRGVDDASGERAAVKVLRHAEAGQRARFEREVTALESLEHPNVVKVLGHGELDDRPYLVLEYVDGGSLADAIAAGPLSPERAAAVGAALADALDHAHERGVVHRDVKPSNVLLDGDGRPRLADFGVAQLDGSGTLTASGFTVGTAAYLAPEQVRGEPVGPPADVYALGLLVLEAATGERAYPGAGVTTAMARLERPPEVPASVPAPLASRLRAMTAMDPAERPTTAAVGPRPGRARRGRRRRRHRGAAGRRRRHRGRRRRRARRAAPRSSCPAPAARARGRRGCGRAAGRRLPGGAARRSPRRASPSGSCSCSPCRPRTATLDLVDRPARRQSPRGDDRADDGGAATDDGPAADRAPPATTRAAATATATAGDRPRPASPRPRRRLTRAARARTATSVAAPEPRRARGRRSSAWRLCSHRSNSAGRIGRDTPKPWPLWQPSPARSWSVRPSSMPSAVTSRSRARARSVMACTMARSCLLLARSSTKERSTFSSSTGSSWSCDSDE